MIGSVALALLVYRRTHSALGATAFFLFAQFVPALLSPLCVARLDQFPARARAAGSVLDRGRDLPGPGLGGQPPLLGRRSCWPWRFLDGTVALTARALARTATVSRHLGRRSAARGQRGRQRRLLGLLHGRPRIGRRPGRRRGHQRRAARRRRAVRRHRASPWPPRGGLPRAPRPRASAPGAACAPRSTTSATQPPIRGLLAPAGVRGAVLHDLGPGRGRVRPAFACTPARPATAGCCRPGVRAPWPARRSTPGGAGAQPVT